MVSDGSEMIRSSQSQGNDKFPVFFQDILSKIQWEFSMDYANSDIYYLVTGENPLRQNPFFGKKARVSSNLFYEK